MTDPRRLRPSELCRLLNSTPLGEVINERQLFRHRTRAGIRIGDERYVDLLRYGAAPVPPPPRAKTSRAEYEARRREFELRRGF